VKTFIEQGAERRAFIDSMPPHPIEPPRVIYANGTKALPGDPEFFGFSVRGHYDSREQVERDSFP
jgi:hypothetical protein